MTIDIKNINIPLISLEKKASTSTSKTPDHLSFKAIPLSSHLIKMKITVTPKLTSLLFKTTVNLFRKSNFDGFTGTSAPHEYVEEMYKNEIEKKIKNYLFSHQVIDFLINEAIKHKIPMASYPRLTAIESLNDGGLTYHFDVSTADLIELKEWKNFAFRSPRRKKYKDLDKQVTAFIDNNAVLSRKQNNNIIEENDWVAFDTTFLNNNNKPITPHLNSSFWLQAQHQQVPNSFISEFFGQESGGSFISQTFDSPDNNSPIHCNNYKYLITIKSIIKGAHFSLEIFKNTYKLKNKNEVHNKLMEVFSYRNDISQRKAIIDEVFHLLLSKHRFEVPKHLVLRREEDILKSLSCKPDYHVYKGEKDFQMYVEMLAEKQLKEEILIDQIAYHEMIKVSLKDIQQYLHLFCNRRLKEFVYFRPQLVKIDELDSPVNATLLSQAVMKEKTLNYIIHMLTK